MKCMYIPTHCVWYCVLDRVSSSNVSHVVIVRPLEAGDYNISWAKLTYTSDDSKEIVSTCTFNMVFTSPPTPLPLSPLLLLSPCLFLLPCLIDWSDQCPRPRQGASLCRVLSETRAPHSEWPSQSRPPVKPCVVYHRKPHVPTLFLLVPLHIFSPPSSADGVAGFLCDECPHHSLALPPLVSQLQQV